MQMTRIHPPVKQVRKVFTLASLRAAGVVARRMAQYQPVQEALATSF